MAAAAASMWQVREFILILKKIIEQFLSKTDALFLGVFGGRVKGYRLWEG